jgi:hypothetical protein
MWIGIAAWHDVTNFGALFSGEERHKRGLAKIAALESEAKS